MTVRPAPHDDAFLHERACIADESTTAALDDLARPLGRSALTVAALVVADALAAVADVTDPVARDPETNTRTRLARPDEDASLLAWLLDANPHSASRSGDASAIEMGDGQAGHLAWSITRAATSIALGYRHTQEEDPPGEALHAVAGRARGLLRYLAAPGQSSRWTDPLPRVATNPGDPELRQRWRTREEQEEAAAAALLTRWLHLGELPREGSPTQSWWQRLGFAPQMYPTLATWCGWLRRHRFLAADDDTLRPGEVPPQPELGRDWQQPVADTVSLLTAHEGLIRRMLTGEVPPAHLLEIDALRPGRLAAAEPDLLPVWQRIGDLLVEHSRLLGREWTLADLGGATRDNPHLSAAVDRAGATCTVLPAGRPQTGGATFDAVLAVGSLHRWPDPEDAVRVATTLLRPGGAFIAVENTKLSPLGLLIAGLLENGFTDATGARLAAPTQDEETWLRLLDAAGAQALGTPVGPTPAILIHARTSAAASPKQVQLDGRDATAGPIRAGTETEVARLWAELLRKAPASRGDSFFELGGDSLRATRFIAAVQQRYGVTVAMRELFARPQLAAVAHRIDIAIAQAGDGAHEEGVL